MLGLGELLNLELLHVVVVEAVGDEPEGLRAEYLAPII